MDKDEIASNLQLVAEDAQLNGWNNLFATEDDSSENEEDDNVEQPELFQSTLTLHGRELTIWQAETGFGSSGEDTTGQVLWGAACCLSDFLLQRPDLVKGKTVLELGCGSCALPSLVVDKFLHPAHVRATDFSTVSLAAVRTHAVKNLCTNLQCQRLDWEDDSGGTVETADLILAADVIYGVALVPALARTIERYARPETIVVVATRDGRRGIPEFLYLLPQTGKFSLTAHVEYPQVPAAVSSSDPNTLARWHGSHSVYYFTSTRPPE